jgi:hypothetical protein
MKKLVKSGILALLFTMGIMYVQAQIYVRVRPSRPAVVVHRPPAPARGHVWVDEEWEPKGTAYGWKGGYWAAPPRPGAVYIKGHWSHRRRGNVWVAGRWR